MPTYKVTDPSTGKTLRLTGDSPPSETELNQIFGSINAPEENIGGQLPTDLDFDTSMARRSLPSGHDITRPVAGAVAPYAPIAGMVAGTAAASPTLAGSVAGGGLGYWAGTQAEQLLNAYAQNKPQQMTPLQELPYQAAEAGTAALLPPVAGETINLGLKAIAPKMQGLAERLYSSAVKMPLSRKWTKIRGPEETTLVKEATRKGIEEEIPVSEYGRAKISSIKKETGQTIEDLAKEIGTGDVALDDILAKGVSKARAGTKFAENTEGELEAIENWIATYKKGKSEIPSGIEMERLKQDLYKNINWDKMSGKGEALTETMRKGLAHELRLQLEAKNPTLRAVNREYAAAKDLEEALERALPRINNRDTFSLGTKILIGKETWPLAILNATLGHPTIKGKLAFLLSRGARNIQGTLPRTNFGQTATMGPEE